MTDIENFINSDEARTATDDDGNKYLWKQHAAKAIGKDKKTLERAAQAGKLKAIEQERQVFYLVADLIEFENNSKGIKQKPVVSDSDMERQTETNLTKVVPDAEKFLAGIAGLFQQINDKLESRPGSKLENLSGKIALDVDEMATITSFSKADLLKAIHAAEKAGQLKRYKGARGKSVWKCADLDTIIDLIEAVEIREVKPPQNKKSK